MAITFTKLGRCTLPATRTLEGYSARDGRAHGELDKVVRACDAHVETARTDWLAGLTPYAVTHTGSSVCGQLTDFTGTDDAA
ncbi:hypothetical protein OHU23_41230 (plasmid) [Streptomyces virginiae]|uniref:hypothetical protein n=1 Tax=Streptomyces virginiae TaxID=1961 RepID=UPI002F912A14